MQLGTGVVGNLDSANVGGDHVGAETYPDSLKTLAKGGQVLTCGATTGPNPDADLERGFWNQLKITGSTMATSGQVGVLELVWNGTFELKISDVLPMSEAAKAHDMIGG